MSDIEEIRNKIDELDEKLLELLNKRAKLALQVKKTTDGKTPIRPERESAIVRRLSDESDGPLPKTAVREIFTQIIASFRDRMQLDRPLSVGYLGPEGTYSEQAAVKIFGLSIDLQTEDSISDVIRSVEAGSTDLAVVPIENSTEGAVRETHKLLFNTSAKIIAEITIPIVHCLLSKSSDISKIKKIYSHPQTLGQCSDWLKKHFPNAEIIPASSNAAAAEKAATEDSAAALSSAEAGKIYDLNILEKGINDQPGNATRFIALGNIPTKPSAKDKTSLICVLVDKPGALYEILKFFAEKNISMTRLESQPYTRGEYAFYIDFRGHKDDPNVSEVIKNIETHTKICQVLGSYPEEIED